jgi:uncharacterized protein DUF2851
MNEEFLYYLWTYRLLNNNLTTTSGDKIVILSPGERNNDSGPDFFNALIEIGDTKWAGNVEIHVNSSDWYKHKHQNDKTYSNIILHVVFNADKNIYRHNKEIIPTLELKNKFDIHLLENYRKFQNSQSRIPCSNLISTISKLDQLQWFDRLLVERLEKKSSDINETLTNTNNDFLQVFYQHLSRALGYTANADSMEMLASITPLKLLLKHINNLKQVEALLYGQSRLINETYKDKYALELSKEYLFLQTKYNLKPIDTSQWKFMRMRPVGFPTIRISQLANLLYSSNGLLNEILESESLNNVMSFLSASASEYWNHHYRFDVLVPGKPKKIGKATINIILVNTIIPFLFVYGKTKNDYNLQEKALNWMMKVQPESNKVTREFADMNIFPENAMQSQAMLQLKSNYCNKKQCLLCKFGHILLNRKSK